MRTSVAPALAAAGRREPEAEAEPDRDRNRPRPQQGALHRSGAADEEDHSAHACHWRKDRVLERPEPENQHPRLARSSPVRFEEPHVERESAGDSEWREPRGDDPQDRRPTGIRSVFRIQIASTSCGAIRNTWRLAEVFTYVWVRPSRGCKLK